MRSIDADAVLAALDPLLFVEALRHGHREGVHQVERLLLSEPTAAATNHLLIWSAWSFGAAAGAKFVAVFPGNEARGAGPNIRSVYVLFDGADGRPLALITGETFTRSKTAADSALGASFLAREDAEMLVVAGAGAQARAQIRFLCAVRPTIRRVFVWNRTLQKAEALARDCALPGVVVAATDNLEEAVRAADIVSCVTSATEPFLRGAWLKPGAHVDLVGSFTPEMRECDDETVLRGRIFADTRRFTVNECGDLAQPIAAGVLAKDAIVADLFDLCAGRAQGRATPAETTVFKNGGGGHLDLMVARRLYELSRASDAGDMG